MRSGRVAAKVAAGKTQSTQRSWRLLGTGLLLPLLALGFFSTPANAQTSPFSAMPTVFAPGGGSNNAVTATVTVHVVAPSAIRSFGIPLGFVGNPEFAILGQEGCTVDGTTVMVAGATCFVTVRFSPLGPGTRTGTLLVTDGAGNNTAFGLSGTGYYPRIAITPAAAKIVTGLGPSSSGYTGDGGTATLATIGNPQGVAADSFGNVYFADTANNVVRMLDAFGNITTIAGGGTFAGAAADGGPAIAATLVQPEWLAVDSAGNLYISETGSHVIRRVAMSGNGTISTVAGSYVAGFSDGSSAVTAKLNQPGGIALDPAGNLYIVDTGNLRIRVVDATSGTISTFAGSGSAGFDPSPVAALSAHFTSPTGIALDPAGSVYLSDTGNHAVRKISSGSVSLAAGTGTAGHTGDGGAATSATLTSPAGLVLTPGGDLYIADTGAGIVRKVEAASGNVETIAGLAKDSGSYTSGVSVATSTRMNGPLGLALDSGGNLYIADSGNNVVRLISTAPGELDFASLTIGNTSASAAVEVANIGNAPMTISSVATADSATANNYVLDNTGATPCASSLAAGTHCAFSVAFAPKVSGFIAGEIDVADNAGPAATNLHPVYLLGGLRVPLAIGPGTLPAVVASHAYNQTVTASGGFGAITVDAVGTLPSGMTSSVSGATVTIAGTPATAGTYSFIVYATDTLGEAAAQTYSIVVLPQTLNLSLAEPVHIADNPSGVLVLTLNLTERVHVADAVYPLPSLLLNVAEAVHITDSVKNDAGLVLTVNEAIQTIDTLQNLPGLLLTLSEAVGVADLATPVSGLILTVPEGIGVADTLQQRAGLLLTVTEAVTVADKPQTTASVLSPTLAQSFNISPTAPGSQSVVTFTLGNPSANTVSLIGVAFSDTLPANLFVYTAPGVSTTCSGATVIAAPGGNAITVSGATIAPGATCIVSVGVYSLVAGTYTNLTGPVTAANASSSGAAATATLTVSGTRGLTIVSPTIHLRQPLNGGPNAYITAVFDFTGTQAPNGAVTMLVNGSTSGITGLTCVAKSLHINCTASYSAAGVAPGTYKLTVSQAADAFYTSVSGTGFVTIAP